MGTHTGHKIEAHSLPVPTIDAPGLEAQAVHFAHAFAGADFGGIPSQIVHVLCLQGTLTFSFQNKRHALAAGDYAIVPNLDLIGEVEESDNLKVLAMAFDYAYAFSLPIRSNYGVIGHLALMQNPVMHLQKEDFERFQDDLMRLEERVGNVNHRFHAELITHLLTAHILDIYDLHIRQTRTDPVSERNAALMTKFVGLLYAGDFKEHRELEYYANKLFVTPHYLSEVCRKLSGRGASALIDRFTIQEVVRLLSDKTLSIEEIADRLNFSSVSYLSRYVKRHTGLSPSVFRSRREKLL